MCGIYGMLSFDGAPADRGQIAAMGQRSLHRGPDDEGIFLDGAVGIGMRRLSIIDLAGGHQPLCNEDRSLWLVANGEIYNYRELSRDLQRDGHRLLT